MITGVEIYSGFLPELQLIKKDDPDKLWREKRSKHFTGSQIYRLMSCGTSTAKKEWGRPEKLIDFGKGAIKYIYEVAKEIQRDYYIQTAETFEMRYGHICEPQVFELIKEKYPDAEKCDFIEYEKLSILGATPDGVCGDFGIEIKAPTNWGAFYERVEQPFDQSHEDFWQLQVEMMVLNVKNMLYVVAEPCKDMFNPVVEKISKNIFPSSEIHQQCILQRCEIAKNAIDLWMSGIKFSEALLESCSNYEIKF